MTRTNETARIFISYARSDGKEFARELRERLEQEGLRVWQDLVAMEGGKDWWRQIASVIQHKELEYLVLAITPRALASPIVRKEWRLARQEGKCVVPVIGSHDLKFEAMPGWMKAAHFINVEEPEQWTRMLRTLQGPCEQERVPFMVEELPADFVHRPDEYEDLVDKLLDREGDSMVTITAALRGAGGYGKTTLARALCHDDRIQDTYHSGVLWVTLGESPGDLTGHIEDLIYVLSNEQTRFSSANAASNRLAELLTDRAILLVVDDVWNAAHARPFLRGGEQCVHLMTTRDATTLPTDARRVPVDKMQASEAVTLLGYNLERVGRRALAELASRLGEWPLLLKLVNARLRERVRQGQTAQAAIDYVNRALDKHGLVAFDARNPEDRHQAAASTLGVSLDVLDNAELARLTELAIFPEDIAVLLETVERLWGTTAGLDDLDTERLAERLFELSLLQTLDLTSRVLRIHDVVRSFLGKRLGEVALPALHSRFLDAWGLDDWSALSPDEPYLWHHLVWHLNEAGRFEEQRALLLDYRWLRAKLSATDITALLADYTCAPDDPAIHAVDGALRLSAHVLGKRKAELPSQITGRLLNHADTSVRALCGQIRESASEPWLRPLQPTLTPPGGPLLQKLEGHEFGVEALAMSNDGQRAVSGSNDWTLRVWDLANGVCLHTLEGHRGSVRSVALSANGGLAISGSFDHTLRVWDLASGACLQTFEGHTQSVKAVALSADGRRAISGSNDETLRVWDLAKGVCLQTFEDYTGGIQAVALSADGQRAVSVSLDHTLRVWDLTLGACVQMLEGHTNLVKAVALSADGQQAISGSHDHTLRVWDLGSGLCLHVIEGHTGRVNAVALSADGRRVVSGSDDQTLRVWDVASGTCLQTLEGEMLEIEAVALSADGRRAVSSSNGPALTVWDLNSGVCLQELESHRGRVFVMALSADDQRVITDSHDHSLCVWDLATETCVHTLNGHTDWVRAVTQSVDGKQAVSGSCDHTLRTWDLTSGACLKTLEGHTGGINAVALSADGLRAVSGSFDKTLRVWDLTSGACIKTFEGHTNCINAVALSADGRQVISGSDDRSLRLWDVDSCTCLQTIEGHTKRINAVALCADGRRAVSGSDDRTLRVWDLENGACLQTMGHHTKRISAVAVCADGRRAISGSADRTLRLWDLDNGACYLSFTGDDSIISVEVTADGSIIIAGDKSGTTHILTLEGAPS